MPLDQSQIDKFNKDGVIIVRDALNQNDINPVIEELNTLIDLNARELYAKGELKDLYEYLPFEKRYGYLYGQNTAIANKLDVMYYRGRAIFNFLHNKNLLDCLESLIGPEITCSPIQHVRTKPPHRFAGDNPFFNVPWHQDAGVTLEEADDSNILTVWLPLAKSTIEMGCMHVLPGACQGGLLPHVSSDYGTMIDPDRQPDIEPLPLECKRGDIVIMNKFTPHFSTYNQTDDCRWSLDLRFQPTGTPTGRPFHPDFVVRSRSNPAREYWDHANWCESWAKALSESKGKQMHRITGDISSKAK